MGTKSNGTRSRFVIATKVSALRRRAKANFGPGIQNGWSVTPVLTPAGVHIRAAGGLLLSLDMLKRRGVADSRS